ncbi:Protein of unknown function [Gryllus bimaculatus]|nr:Protein of unknown function [Gryllus bimaculatus]
MLMPQKPNEWLNGIRPLATVEVSKVKWPSDDVIDTFHMTQFSRDSYCISAFVSVAAAVGDKLSSSRKIGHIRHDNT